METLNEYYSKQLEYIKQIQEDILEIKNSIESR